MRLHPFDESELKWYWEALSSELGLKSWFTSFKDKLEVGPQAVPAGGSSDDDRRLRVLGRARSIEKVLGRMSRENVRVLKRYVTSESDAWEKKEIGEIARGLPKSARRQLRNLSSRDLDKARANARDAVVRAVSDWEQCRPSGGRTR